MHFSIFQKEYVKQPKTSKYNDGHFVRGCKRFDIVFKKTENTNL
jgi:hypothetical protein